MYGVLSYEMIMGKVKKEVRGVIDQINDSRSVSESYSELTEERLISIMTELYSGVKKGDRPFVVFGYCITSSSSVRIDTSSFESYSSLCEDPECGFCMKFK